MAEIQAAILCDYAQVRDGLLFVVSGGINLMKRPTLPASMGVHLAVILDIGPEEENLVHEIKVNVLNLSTRRPVGAATAALEIVRPEGIDASKPVLAPLAIDLSPIQLDSFARYELTLNVDKGGPKILSFEMLPLEVEVPS